MSGFDDLQAGRWRWKRANPDLLGLRRDDEPAPRRYQPTAGMLRALTDANGADEMDYVRCRLRGLIDVVRCEPTEAGAAAISRELKRRQGVWPRG